MNKQNSACANVIKVHWKCKRKWSCGDCLSLDGSGRSCILNCPYVLLTLLKQLVLVSVIDGFLGCVSVVSAMETSLLDAYPAWWWNPVHKRRWSHVVTYGVMCSSWQKMRPCLVFTLWDCTELVYCDLWWAVRKDLTLAPCEANLSRYLDIVIFSPFAALLLGNLSMVKWNICMIKGSWLIAKGPCSQVENHLCSKQICYSLLWPINMEQTWLVTSVFGYVLKRGVEQVEEGLT